MSNFTPPETDLRSDIGPFSMVPEWLLDSEVSHGAIRLFAVLARYTNSGRVSWPSRATLARRVHSSKDTVDRYIKELEGINALTVEHRKEKTKDGKLINRSNLYTIRFTPPGVAASVRPPSRNGAATGSRATAAQKDNQLELKPKNEEAFDIFWSVYDKKVGKKAARIQWQRHIKDEATAQRAITAAAELACTTDKQFRKDPERWIRDHRWEDETVPTGQPLTGSQATVERLRVLVMEEGLAND